MNTWRRRAVVYGLGGVIIFSVAVLSTTQTDSGKILFHHTNSKSSRPKSYSKSQASTQSNLPRPLFYDSLSGTSRIVTNEFVHWSPNDGCSYTSSTWDMTSGTLMIQNNAGYSGVPTEESHSVCESKFHNNSAIFRLNTKQSNFTNVAVSMDYKAVTHGGGGAPNNSYDGIHIWVGYQTQYALYIATVFRWDDNLVIKKKVPVGQAKCSDPANDGCYYNLTDEKVHTSLNTANVWHHAIISFRHDSANTVTITETIDGQRVFQAVDNKVHGATYPSGAVGVRGDNTEFYFKNFTVTAL